MKSAKLGNNAVCHKSLRVVIATTRQNPRYGQHARLHLKADDTGSRSVLQLPDAAVCPKY